MEFYTQHIHCISVKSSFAMILQSYREGLQLLCQAYDSDPRNPAVLNLLAHYCLTRKEYSKVVTDVILLRWTWSPLQLVGMYMLLVYNQRSVL